MTAGTFWTAVAALAAGIGSAVVVMQYLNEDDDACEGVYATPESTVELFFCHQGPAVADLQRDLMAAGFDLESTARYDEETRQAVIAFQRGSSDLVVDGMAGPDTRRRLEQAAGTPGG